MILLVEYWLSTLELDRAEDVLDMSEAVVRDGMARVERASAAAPQASALALSDERVRLRAKASWGGDCSSCAMQMHRSLSGCSRCVVVQAAIADDFPGANWRLAQMLGIRPQLLRTPLQAALPRAAARRSYASHGPTYNPPSGYLFGEKPLPKGQKRQWESWELIYYVGMFGGMALATVILVYKPDTSIQTWALEEAKKRMEERGEKVEYKPSRQA